STRSLATSSLSLSTSARIFATSTHILATSTHILATSTHILATSTRILATSTHILATPTCILATPTRILATSTHILATTYFPYYLYYKFTRRSKSSGYLEPPVVTGEFKYIKKGGEAHHLLNFCSYYTITSSRSTNVIAFRTIVYAFVKFSLYVACKFSSASSISFHNCSY